MPNVNDIVTLAEAMEKSPVAIAQDRCVRVRNRNASCRKCVDSCPHGAIEVAGNRLSLSASSCVGCGACVVACPTEALVALKPADADLAGTVRASACANGGAAVIACARIASKRTVPTERFAEVPCLARMEPSIIIGALAGGATALVAVDGGCATCKHRDCARNVDAVLDAARAIVHAHGSDAPVARMTGFPEEMRGYEDTAQYGATRRGFFTEAIGAARETTMTAARVTIAHELGYSAPEQSIGERLRVSKDGKLPAIRIVRHEVLLNAMDALGAPSDVVLETGLFATLDIDLSQCNACGMCATFCPTAALVRDRAAKASDSIKYLEFSACDCVNCGLCADVCWKGALSLSQSVALSEIYDFEPRTFDLSHLGKKKSLFGR